VEHVRYAIGTQYKCESKADIKLEEREREILSTVIVCAKASSAYCTYVQSCLSRRHAAAVT
jgi:hypothetical protein